MAITSFIPKVWSARLLENFNRALVIGALCNRNYEGDIAQFGDTVHINNLADITVKAYTPGSDIDDPEQLATDDRTLTIDHGAYYNFFVNDVDAAQARADLMDPAMRNAAQKLAEDTEDYIVQKIVSEAGVQLTGSLKAGAVYEAIVALKTQMDEKNVPKTGRFLIVPPSIEGELLLDPRFITANGQASENRLVEGSVAKAAGFDIYVSNALTDKMLAFNRDCVTFAQQIIKTEAYRREKGFDDGVKGLSLCGAKVVLPNYTVVYTITDALAAKAQTPVIPTIGALTVTASAGADSTHTKLAVAQTKDDSNVYKVKVSNGETSVAYGQSVQSWKAWNGIDEIECSAGQTVTVVEADNTYKAIRAGSATVEVGA